jgi:hypothetical protein
MHPKARSTGFHNTHMPGTGDGNTRGSTRGYTWPCPCVHCSALATLRTAGAPAGGGKADTPAGAVLLMDLHACAVGEGEHGDGGSPNAEVGELHQQTRAFVLRSQKSKTALTSSLEGLCGVGPKTIFLSVRLSWPRAEGFAGRFACVSARHFRRHGTALGHRRRPFRLPLNCVGPPPGLPMFRLLDLVVKHPSSKFGALPRMPMNANKMSGATFYYGNSPEAQK